MRLLIVGVLAALLASASSAFAGLGQEATQKLYERVSPSLVAVKYTWESELGRRELAGTGIVVSDEGLVVCQLALFNMIIPDVQLTDFKIIVPDPAGGDADEIDAVLHGRDERYNLAFLQPKGNVKGAAKDGKKDDAKKEEKNEDKKSEAKAADEEKKVEPSNSDEKNSASKDAGEKKDAKTSASKDADENKHEHKWVPIKFEDAAVKVGEPVFSVGLLPEMAAYKSYIIESAVSVTLRGETPQVLVQGGGLTAVGSVVFNADDKAIGIVNMQGGQTPLLNDAASAMNAINNPPRFYLPAKDFLPALADPPSEGHPIKMPWIGVPQLTGLNKDVSEVYGLTNKPAVQVGEVIPDTPAAKAGLKQRDIIVTVDSQPLERGDEPDELPQIFRRQMGRMKVGQTIKFGVLRKKGEPLQEISVTTEEMPKRANKAKRWYAEDLGFSAREMVFTDTYVRRLKRDAKGVVVALVRPQSAAQNGGLKMNDLITELNREPVENIDSFKKSYEAFRKSKPKEAVVMVVLREGNTQTIRIEPPQ
jgi:S1-C subfamily serine protease